MAVDWNDVVRASARGADGRPPSAEKRSSRGTGTQPPRRPRWRGRRVVGIASAVIVAAVIVVVAATSGGPPQFRRLDGPSEKILGPSGTRVLFSDSFDSGNWCRFSRVQNPHYSDPACGYRGQSYSLTDDAGAARFEVRPGDAIGGGLGNGERSELSLDGVSWQAHEGDEWYVQERLRLATDFEPGRAWTIITQFHSGSDSPPLALEITHTGTLVLHSAGPAGNVNAAAGRDDRELISASTLRQMRGQWFDVDLHIRWSNRLSAGGTAVYVNGTLVAPWRTQRTMATSRNYWKAGIYRAPSHVTQVLWLKDVVISTPA